MCLLGWSRGSRSVESTSYAMPFRFPDCGGGGGQLPVSLPILLHQAGSTWQHWGWGQLFCETHHWWAWPSSTYHGGRDGTQARGAKERKNREQTGIPHLVRCGEDVVVLGAEVPGPRVKHLDHLSAAVYLLLPFEQVRSSNKTKGKHGLCQLVSFARLLYQVYPILACNYSTERKLEKS